MIACNLKTLRGRRYGFVARRTRTRARHLLWLQMRDDATVEKQGAAFYAIDGDEVTLFVPDAGAFGEGAYGRVVSPTGGAATEQAWRELMDTALRLADHIELQRGDALIINNVRACHGRTAFNPKLDGSDRWLVKTYLTSNLWSRP